MKRLNKPAPLNKGDCIGMFTELIISKPENLNTDGSSFSYSDLLFEIIGNTPHYPIIENFDCGHTIPMITIPQDVLFEIYCDSDMVSVIQHEFGYCSG